MKIRGRNLKKRLYGRVDELRNRLSRARYFRGHGVHSPFVYDIVRTVFMRRTLIEGDRTLYNALVDAGVSTRRAMQLQNLAVCCSYRTFGLNRVEGEFCVILADEPREKILEVVRTATTIGATVAILAPGEGAERRDLCRMLVATHKGTSVDNRGYLLLFNNNLPKQHYRI